MARRARWAALGLSLLLTGGAVVAPARASAAPVAPMAGPVPGASPDFDGDGKADLAAGIYLDQSDQYALRIWYGSGAVTDVTSADAGGPVVTDGEGGLRGPLLARDFNGDGYCDLAFTSPGAHLSVVQVFGLASGLDLAGRHTTEVAAAGDTLYAKALALVSAPKRRLAVGYSISRGESRFARVGVFDLATSSAPSGTPLILRAGSGGMPKLADWTFGDALAASGNRLFLGMPLATVSGHKYAAAVVEVTMGATGVSSAKAITQSTSGVTGVAGKGDNFGGSLAAADGYLAVGAPWDDVESVKNTGSVQVFTVTSKGLTPVRRVSQYGSAVPGKAEPYDIFGYSVAFGPQLRGRHQPDRRRPGRSDRTRARERWCCVAGAAHLGQGLCRRPVVRGSWTVRTTALCVCGLRRRRSA